VYSTPALGGIVKINAKAARSGNFGLQVEQVTRSPSSNGIFFFFQHEVRIPAGTLVECSVWHQLLSSTSSLNGQIVMAIDNQLCGPVQQFSTSYAKYSGQLKVLGDVHSILIRVILPILPTIMNTPLFNLDDVFVTPLSGPDVGAVSGCSN
jgi:hypothetical protein